MEELRKLVDELIALPGGDDEKNNLIIEKLQMIGKKLVTEYEIKVGKFTVEPIWVEAYYSNPKQGFFDKSAHDDEAQKDNFGGLYFHQRLGSQSNRNGVDLCLSASKNVCLSYLLKISLVNGENANQPELAKRLHQEYLSLQENKKKDIVEKRKENADDLVLCTERVFKELDKKTTEEQNDPIYSRKTAIVRVPEKAATNAKIPGLSILLTDHIASFTGSKEDECRRLLGYCPEQYKKR